MMLIGFHVSLLVFPYPQYNSLSIPEISTCLAKQSLLQLGLYVKANYLIHFDSNFIKFTLTAILSDLL